MAVKNTNSLKKLVLKNYKEELKKYNASPAMQELVLNLVEHHNNLISNYNAGEIHQEYLTYQLKQQLYKILTDLKKDFQKNNVVIEESLFDKNFND